MNVRKIFSSVLIYFLKLTFAKRRNKTTPRKPESFLIIRQHNQFGDMLATIPLFKTLKKNYPGASITLIASPENYFAVAKNKYIDEVFNFDKKLLWSFEYLKNFVKVLRKGYDIAVVPVTVSVSSTSCIMARLAKCGYSIGPESLDGVRNKLNFVFDETVEMDWRKKPELNVSRFCLNILAPLGIASDDFTSHITFYKEDEEKADEFLKSLGNRSGKIVAGFHIGAGKPPNRWPADNFITIIKQLKEKFGIIFYFTGSSSDINEITAVKNEFGNEAGYLLNKPIPELAAVISKSSIFITNDTGVMHVAGAVNVPQISIFGPTNPNNWAPEGKNKFVIKNTDMIDSVKAADVFSKAEEIIMNGIN